MTEQDVKDKVVAKVIDDVAEVLQSSGISVAEALGVLAFVNGLILHQGFAALQDSEKSED